MNFRFDQLQFQKQASANKSPMSHRRKNSSLSTGRNESIFKINQSPEKNRGI
jgi:hypothetical protein